MYSLVGLATLLNAVAIGAGVLVAHRGLSNWRQDMVGRRKAEVAEETLRLFYEARDSLEYVRSSGRYSDEGATRERSPHESDDARNYMDDLFVPIERLNKQSEFWARFQAAKYPFVALFGEAEAKPIKSILDARGRVIGASSMLRRAFKRHDAEDKREQVERWKVDLGWAIADDNSGLKRDEVGDMVEGAISDIEKVCRPAILGTKD